VQRILIVRFSSIGDIVLTSPVVRVLRQRFPQADIRFLTKEPFAELVAHNPHLNGVVLFKDDLRATISEVRAFRPDAVIDLHHNLRTALLKAAVGTKAFSFPKLNVEKWLHVNLRLDVLPDRHIVQRYMEAVLPLGAEDDGRGLEFFVPDEVTMPPLPDGFADGYVAVAVGAKFATKRIPQHKLKAIIEGLSMPVVLLGGKEDAALAEGLLFSGEKMFNGCGKWSLLQSARAVANARAVVTGDTGLMHIAAAFQRPTVSIWGSTVPVFGMTPYMPECPELSVIFEQKGLDCRPCSKIGFDRCPKGHFRCMEELEVAEVVKVVEGFM
jgi:ADP-heptose:LPS heptosyltransferase